MSPSDPVPGAEAAAFYQEHGWYATGTILPDELLDRADEAIRGLDADHRDLDVPRSLREFLAWPPGEPRPTRLNQYICLQYRAMAELASFPALARIAALLAGSRRLRIFNTALIRKRPGSAEQYAQVGWHCDRAYWATCSSERMTTAWVPLQDTTVSMGTLAVLSGSHTWPDTDEVRALRTAKTFIAEDHDALWSRLESLRSDGVTVDVRQIELKRGQVSFHHPLTLHGSGVNLATTSRNAISVHYQDGANRYQPATGADGAPATYVHDPFVRRRPNGDPDYADPEVCPPVWPPTAPSWPG
ncbi:phytanoyl-CoA dioxygenase family protein [Streptomyces sp. BE282]|uniref:phytanoyl-CoA dioxygenase family protein n=1 Tax=Streptomyces sp. BE282 TaxID=3002527 RepID=UPI002E77F46D|nr:phytanoyl-CoA dioxygenase family protein [Streptomyces sp. BE282]MEE1729358.1 phytanoyl-CoA dioxygenase family protein [Streptomyces sp. BE282]